MKLTITNGLPVVAPIFDKYLRIERRRVTVKMLRIMKLICLFMIIGCLHIHAIGISQKVTLNVKAAPLKQVLTSIKKQTGYSFLCDDALLDRAKPVTVDMKGVELSDALRICLRDQNLSFSFADKIIVISLKVGSQSHPPATEGTVDLFPIKGIVRDAEGNPLPGATIQVKNNTAKALSNEKGEFEIAGNKGQILVFSYVGFETQEVTITNESSLLISMIKKVTASEEVIVANTGYQNVKPNETNGSVVVINNKTLNEQTGTNILDRINGLASGVLFNVGKQDAKGKINTFSVRGLSTINASLEPLIVLDNFPYTGDLNNINPNDVESITILKDAAATSIYGVRGGNGVVVITTKKGRYNQKTTLDLNINTIVSQEPDQYYLPRMSSNDYVDVELMLFNSGYFDNLVNVNAYSPLTPGVQILQRRKMGLITAADSAAQIDALRQVDSRNDFSKYFYSNGLVRQYSLTVRGGSANLAWLIGGAYDKSEAPLGATNDKVNFHLNNSYRATNNLELTLGVYFTNTSTLSGKVNPDVQTVRNAPYVRYADENGTPLSVGYSFRDSFTDTVGGGKLLDWKRYPLEDYKHDRATNNSTEILANIGINYKFLKWFKISANYQQQRQWYRNRRLSDVESYTVRDLVNRFTNLNAPLTSPEIRYPVPIGAISASTGGNNGSKNGRMQMGYEQIVGKNNISAIVGGELREIRQWGAFSLTSYGFSEDPIGEIPVNFTNVYPTYFGGTGKVPGPPRTGGELINRYVSVYGNASYTYNQLYSISGSFRKDASNIFGLSANDKWNPLWSGGVGWNFSREKFFKSKLVSYARLKATVGFSGNLDLSKTALPILTYGNNLDMGVPAARIMTLNDPRLKWEKSRQINIGLEFGITGGRISGTLEYYEKKGTDLYGETPYDYTTFGAYTTVIKNVAAMKGKGIDFTLRSLNIDKNIKWNTTLLYQYNTNKTTAYFSESAQIGDFIIGSGGNIISPIIGKPLYAIAAYRWGGLDASGRPQGYLNGALSVDYGAMALARSGKGIYSEDVVYIGSSSPTSFGSVINQVSWKGFSASFNLVYKFGYYFRNSSLSYLALVNDGLGHPDYARRWQRPGDEKYTSIPAFIYPIPSGSNQEAQNFFYQASAVHVHKADNLRLQYINLSYSVKKIEKLSLQSLQIYLNAANLGIIWKAYKGNVDPDYPSAIPPSKSITIGLRVQF